MSYVHRQKLQECLALANQRLEEAKSIADQIGESFEFLGRRYEPKRTIVGHWDHEGHTEESSWDSSDDGWSASGTGC